MLPLVGDLSGHITGLSRVEIHGDVYFDIIFVRDFATPQAAQPVRIRIAQHLVPKGRELHIADRIRLSFVLGQVSGVALESAGTPSRGENSPHQP